MGISAFDIVQANAILGPVNLVPGANTYFVNNATTGLPDGALTGSDGNDGKSPASAFSTISKAISVCAAGRGDTIFVMPGHAQTLTAVQSIATSNISIIGVRVGNLRPTFTINAVADLFSLDAAGITLQGLKLTLVTASPTALVNVTKANCTLRDIQMIPSTGAVAVVDCVTLASGSDDFLMEDCRIINPTNAVNSFVSFEAAASRMILKNNYFTGKVTTAGLIDGALITDLNLDGNKIKTVGTNIPACILDSNPTGDAFNNHMYGTDATIANNAQWGSALILGNNFTRGGTGSTVSASNIIPALDT